MTDQLTQEEAERCAEALGWILKPFQGVMHYAEGVADWCELSLDPYFWFPRLWQRLEELAVEKYGDNCHVYVQRDGLDRLIYQAGAEEWGSADAPSQGNSPSSAICAAIELLTAANVKEMK